MFRSFLLTEYFSLTIMPHRIVPFGLFVNSLVYLSDEMRCGINFKLHYTHSLQLTSFCQLFHLRDALHKLSFTQLPFNERCSLSIESAIGKSLKLLDKSVETEWHVSSKLSFMAECCMIGCKVYLFINLCLIVGVQMKIAWTNFCVYT